MQDRYGDHPSPAARDRLELELDVICRMGFASYFLIVADFVRFAAERGIPAGARGSACGARNTSLPSKQGSPGCLDDMSTANPPLVPRLWFGAPLARLWAIRGVQ